MRGRACDDGGTLRQGARCLSASSAIFSQALSLPSGGGSDFFLPRGDEMQLPVRLSVFSCDTHDSREAFFGDLLYMIHLVNYLWSLWTLIILENLSQDPFAFTPPEHVAVLTVFQAALVA